MNIEWLPSLMLLAGFIIGLGAAYIFRIFQGKTAKELAEALYSANAQQQQAQLQSIIDHVKASFGHLSLEALSKSTEEFLKLAHARLGSEREINIKELSEKKELIDQQLVRMSTELEGVSRLMQTLEKDRVEKFGEISTQLKMTGEQTASLLKATNTLREALASSKIRGQWGERMAEDVLRMAGMLEHVNYLKQKTMRGSQTRPDFTFLLPNDLKLNMDVKFPLDNYIRYLEAPSDLEKQKFRSDFLRDVRQRIKEITSRDYINPENNTVDYVLLFIPNEQVYAFVNEQDSSILDEGLKQHVVVCSPMTLFAVLAVIRQAVENFALEKTSGEILKLLGTFKKQWDEFINKFEHLGKRLGEAYQAYETLATTRRRQLEKPLDRIDALRSQRSIPEELDEGEDTEYQELPPARKTGKQDSE